MRYLLIILVFSTPAFALNCLTGSDNVTCLEEPIVCSGNYATDYNNYYWPIADLCKKYNDADYAYGYYLGVSVSFDQEARRLLRSNRSKDALIKKLKKACGSRCKRIR